MVDPSQLCEGEKNCKGKPKWIYDGKRLCFLHLHKAKVAELPKTEKPKGRKKKEAKEECPEELPK